MGGLDPFVFHGVIFHKIGEQSVGNCIWCGKEDHFYVEQQRQLWNCKRCGRSGNLYGFLRQIHEQWFECTTSDDYERLSRLRRGAAEAWQYEEAGLAWDQDRALWLMPINGFENLRIWREKGGPLISTKGIPSQMWGLKDIAASGPIWVVEGEWDAIALKVLNPGGSVVAVPGASVFKKEWMEALSGREVIMAYDADSAGDEGMCEKGDKLRSYTSKVRYIRWPMEVNKGYDISDLIVDCGKERALEKLLEMVSDSPRTRISARVKMAVDKDVTGVTFDDIVDQYSGWLDVSPDLEMALKVVLATILSTQISGDPVWIYIVAPPGGGKTAILYPFRSVSEYCVFRSNLTSRCLVSGWQSKTDPSLIPQLDGKTLILKDMTELLSAHPGTQEEVFGTLRGIYDGSLERSYGNQVYRKYESHFSMVAGVTVSIHGHHHASMGERMLKFQLSRTLGEKETIIKRAIDNVGMEENLEEKLAQSISSFLRRKVNIGDLNDKIPPDHWMKGRIVAISQLIAHIRTEVERDGRGDQVMYRPEHEIGTRLAKQLWKLGLCLTEVEPDINKVWATVERVAFDTAIGWNLDIIQAMMNHGNGQMSRGELVKASNLPRSNVNRRLEDMLLTGTLSSVPVGDKFGTVDFKLCDDIKRWWKEAGVQDDHSTLVGEIRKSRQYRIGPMFRGPNKVV